MVNNEIKIRVDKKLEELSERYKGVPEDIFHGVRAKSFELQTKLSDKGEVDSYIPCSYLYVQKAEEVWKEVEGFAVKSAFNNFVNKKAEQSDNDCILECCLKIINKIIKPSEQMYRYIENNIIYEYYEEIRSLELKYESANVSYYELAKPFREKCPILNKGNYPPFSEEHIWKEDWNARLDQLETLLSDGLLDNIDQMLVDCLYAAVIVFRHLRFFPERNEGRIAEIAKEYVEERKFMTEMADDFMEFTDYEEDIDALYSLEIWKKRRSYLQKKLFEQRDEYGQQFAIRYENKEQFWGKVSKNLLSGTRVTNIDFVDIVAEIELVDEVIKAITCEVPEDIKACELKVATETHLEDEQDAMSKNDVSCANKLEGESINVLFMHDLKKMIPYFNKAVEHTLMEEAEDGKYKWKGTKVLLAYFLSRILCDDYPEKERDQIKWKKAKKRFPHGKSWSDYFVDIIPNDLRRKNKQRKENVPKGHEAIEKIIKETRYERGEK